MVICFSLMISYTYEQVSILWYDLEKTKKWLWNEQFDGVVIISLPQKKKKIGVSHVDKGRVASDTNNHYKDCSSDSVHVP